MEDTLFDDRRLAVIGAFTGARGPPMHGSMPRRGARNIEETP
jgi:hypothetical protein